ncbi:MAG: biopolymer transporter ExbD [Acidobacteria bacterium]|nr:biopolymer transporter ExbD [Acidobacteriota bacterium]
MAFTDPREETRTNLSEINVTPLVDVMLVLLVIFMVTAPILQTGVQVNLPRTSSAEAATPKLDAIIVTIDPQSNIFVGTGSRASHVPINVNQLAERLRELSALSREPRVFVRADAETPYKTVAYVLGRCRAAGAAVSLVTEVQEPGR